MFAAVLAVTAYRIAAAGEGWLFDCGVGMLMCAAALLRERDRTAATAVGLAVAAAAALTSKLGHLTGEPGVATSLALMVLGGSAVRTLPPRRAAVIAGAGLAVMALGWLTTTPRPAAHPAPVQFGVLGWIAAIGVGLALRFLDFRRQAAAEMVRRDERLALARELHDVVAHHISGIVVQTQAARIVRRKQPASEALDDALADIERSGTDALDAMSRVVALLRDADDGAATTSGPEQLTELVRRFEVHGPAVHLQMPTGHGPWPPEVTTTVYRVVQESLTNIARHARHARSAAVTITQDQEDITVEITDDAPHSPVRHSPRGGYGLVGMRERVEALGGTLGAGPRPSAGWSVHASLPVPAGDRR
ncbi:sensor histidine kinase [Actinacidiphila oryziradicis]|uniref:histidine kinase n=2 Tax=Actinacidiphila oryziradicis TaxID=2571141 RepID=A0A4U0RQ72_9ACTN|nr:sensor histidine kinase [Actinacidiphila oryziradicis]